MICTNCLNFYAVFEQNSSIIESKQCHVPRSSWFASLQHQSFKEIIHNQWFDQFSQGLWFFFFFTPSSIPNPSTKEQLSAIYLIQRGACMPCRPDSSALVTAGAEAFGRKQAVKWQSTESDSVTEMSTVLHLHTGGRGRDPGGPQSTLVLLRGETQMDSVDQHRSYWQPHCLHLSFKAN